VSLLNYPIPPDEESRLEALDRLCILDTAPEDIFDHVTRTVARALDVPIALISLIDRDRQWSKSRFGLDILEPPRDQAFCAHAIMNDAIMVVSDATRDSRFSRNPLVVGEPFIRFYAGAPLIAADGQRIGTLCAIDSRSRRITDDQQAILGEQAKLVIALMALRLTARQVIDAKLEARQATEERTREKIRGLQVSDDRFHEIAANVPGIVFQFRVEPGGTMNFPYVSPAIVNILGVSSSMVMAAPDKWFELIHPEDRARFFASNEESRRNRSLWSWKGRAFTPDGGNGWFSSTATPHPLADGAMLWNGLWLDTTGQTRFNESLRQSRKLDQLGRLTGGVAHDFNNLLAVIQGNTEMLAEQTGLDNPHVLSIRRAAQRGADLTYHLLAYARRQPLRPRQLDLGGLIRHTTPQVRQSLGPTIPIDLEIDPALWPTMADPGQVENAIFNLAVNARDAMPDGGRLTIGCANAHLDKPDIAALLSPEDFDAIAPGDYIVLSVNDTGGGMAADVASHAFEPFFTTKEVGQGSGLGLSMVYGFARQSGGIATIVTAPGQGTTVSMYLPRAIADIAREPPGDTSEIRRGRGETVLVVDDDDDMRELVVRMLGSLGYQTREAVNGETAELQIESDRDIRLVLTDVKLNGSISGDELESRLRLKHTRLPVIFMSGYPLHQFGPGQQPTADRVLLQKPFNKAMLAQVLRRALDHANPQP
jgi:signal transduction histidine kinase